MTTHEKDSPISFAFVTESDERIVVTITPTGLTFIQSGSSSKVDDGKPLESIIATGLSYAEAKAKERGFWQKLWDTIKSAVTAVVEAVTVDVGPLRCRPTGNAKVDLKGPRLESWEIGVTCSPR